MKTDRPFRLKRTTAIVLNNLKFYAYHGVLPQERTIGGEYLLSLRLGFDFDEATYSDVLEDTINYADVYKSVKAEMEIPSQLLEHVGGRILTRLFADFPRLDKVELKLIKCNPPMGADCEGAGVEISEERSDLEKFQLMREKKR